MAYITTIDGNEVRIQVAETKPNLYQVTLGDKSYTVDFLEPQKNLFSLIIDGHSYEVDVDVDAAAGGDRYVVAINENHFELEVADEKKKKLAMKMARGASGRQDLKSPMAGNVRAVLVEPGAQVTAGQVLLILEAMKMQNEITSPIDGVVASVTAREGVPVAPGDPLCVIEPPPEPAVTA